MFRLIVILAVITVGTQGIPRHYIYKRDVAENVDVPQDVEQKEIERAQNQNAKYEFFADVQDNINDLTQNRKEVRENGKVVGSYSYSDGYNRRTVSYEADENGYRIISTEVVPLDGPHIDENGSASVRQEVHGKSLRYTVKSVPGQGPVYVDQQ